MGQRIAVVLVVFLIMLFSKIFAQQTPCPVFVSTPEFKKSIPVKNFKITPDFYIRSLGFVCKQEYLLEKKTKLPLRFRLGSLVYADKLEGKKQ